MLRKEGRNRKREKSKRRGVADDHRRWCRLGRGDTGEGPRLFVLMRQPLFSPRVDLPVTVALIHSTMQCDWVDSVLPVRPLGRPGHLMVCGPSVASMARTF
jgi:hypothetical protein